MESRPPATAKAGASAAFEAATSFDADRDLYRRESRVARYGEVQRPAAKPFMMAVEEAAYLVDAGQSGVRRLDDPSLPRPFVAREDGAAIGLSERHPHRP